ncbi:MAG TPA: YIP1 family protein [Anaerolineaceae bacterium]|nr:YIP1 family protein [Anaerolineaceae bacterium]HPN53749.1 YIP1 family protein [Anaerolineaceae bacterium]
MAETELLPFEKPRRFRFDLVFPALFKPKQTFAAILADEKGNWLTPLLVLSILAVILVLAAGPIRQQIASVPPTPPEDFQWWTPEQQAQFMASGETRSSPLFIYGLPALNSLLQVWVGWALLAAVLHLTLTLSGSRHSFTSALNLVGWASLPFGIRFIVQTVYYFSTQTLIASPGLSGFVPAGMGGGTNFLIPLLGMVDLYLIWQFALVVIGAASGSQMPAAKAAITCLVAFLITLVLFALPGFAVAQLSSLSVARPFFF